MSLYSLSYNFNFSDLIPSEQKKYLQKEAWKFKRIFKFFRRYLYMYFTGQLKLERDSISSETKTILWINTTAPSLGDSLMDLSGRVLLKNYEVDLYTSSKNSILYKYDEIFKNVYDENNLNFDKNYDLIIVDSYSPRSMKIKNQYFKRTPFVGMYGFLNGFDIHRTLFSFYRICELLNMPYDQIVAKPSIGVDEEQIAELPPAQYVTIVVGGEWDFRTYKKWDNVIELIGADNIVLVGSKNGIDYANIICSKYTNIKNFVGKLSINQTAIIIRECSIVLCCDGGLLHISNALFKPVVSLFGAIDPLMRHTSSDVYEFLYDENSVNNISPVDIYHAYLKLKGKI